MTGVVRVGICDDHALSRRSFTTLFEPEPDIEVVGEAADGRQALALARRCAPDVLLMDVRMPVLDGIEATRRLVAAGFAGRVLVLTTSDLDEYVFEALRAGASGFLLKDVEPDELVEAVRVVARGDALLAPRATRRLLDALAHRIPRRDPEAVRALAALTPREREVLDHVAQGRTNASIARR